MQKVIWKKLFLSIFALVVGLTVFGAQAFAANNYCSLPPSAKKTDNYNHYCIDCASNNSSTPTTAPNNSSSNNSASNNSVANNGPTPTAVNNVSNGCVNPGATICTSANCDLIGHWLNPAINVLAGLVGIAVVIGIIIGAVQYSASAGDPQGVAKAKGRIMSAIIAFIAFAFLYVFLQWIVPGGIFNKG